MRLSARGPGRPPAPIAAEPDWSLAQLKSAVELALGVPAAAQTLRVGFPPHPLPDGDETATLATLGLADGEVVVVEQRGGVVSAAQEHMPKHAKTAAGSYHGSEADAARQQRQAAEAGGATAGFREGERVLYRGREQTVAIDGQPVSIDAEQVVTIVSITTAGLQAGEEPMVAVRLASGTIRDTTFSRLSAYRAPQGEGEGGYVPPPSSATS